MAPRLSHKALAYFLLRLSFGVNFLGHGLFRILSGVGAFASATATHMLKSPLPHDFVYMFALAIPWIELLLGLALLIGIATRIAMLCGSLFMLALTIGVTSIQQWDVTTQQLLYSVVFFLLLFGLEYNSLSLDYYLKVSDPPTRSQS